MESKNGETLLNSNKFVHTRNKTCTTNIARKMKNAIGGDKEDEVMTFKKVLKSFCVSGLFGLQELEHFVQAIY